MQKHGVTKTFIHSRLREAWRGCSNGPWRHQETSWEIRLGPGLISSCPDWCSSFQPRRLQPEGSLYNVYRHPHLPASNLSRSPWPRSQSPHFKTGIQGSSKPSDAYISHLVS